MLELVSAIITSTQGQNTIRKPPETGAGLGYSGLNCPPPCPERKRLARTN